MGYGIVGINVVIDSMRMYEEEKEEESVSIMCRSGNPYMWAVKKVHELKKIQAFNKIGTKNFVFHSFYIPCM